MRRVIRRISACWRITSALARRMFPWFQFQNGHLDEPQLGLGDRPLRGEVVARAADDHQVRPGLDPLELQAELLEPQVGVGRLDQRALVEEPVAATASHSSGVVSPSSPPASGVNGICTPTTAISCCQARRYMFCVRR